jgi:ketosteroid isomerase-like protein
MINAVRGHVNLHWLCCLQTKGEPYMKHYIVRAVLFGSLATFASTAARGSSVADEKTVAALDTEYQAAVKNNDAATMDRILADDFDLVLGSGARYTKSDLLQMERTSRIRYQHQEDSDQTVRVWGDTAVVTAKLWTKGIDQGKAFEFFVFFSDTYVRTPSGWRYVHGQASLPLTNATK